MDNTTLKHEIKDGKLHFNYQCKECGTISNLIDFSPKDDVGEILHSYLLKHSLLHELAETGKLTKKFVRMVKDV